MCFSAGAAVVVERLTVLRSGRPVLDDLSFQLDGGVLALVGANGAGKSTLLRVLATLLPASSGRVCVGGHAMQRRSGAAAARTCLGYLGQDPQHSGHLTVAEAVEYAAWLKAVPRRTRRAMVDSTLVDLDLTELADTRLAVLSGGTRRRAHLAQAIVHRPAVLLLDEPTTGLDSGHRAEFQQLLRRLAVGRVVVLCTHLSEDVQAIADRVIALADGRITFDGSPGELAALGAAANDRPTDASTWAIERGLRHLGSQ